MFSLKNDWSDALSAEQEKTYYKNLINLVKNEYKTKTIFPEKNNVFNAFNHTPLSSVKCVIIGQDPYHNIGQAHGLSFSVKPGVAIPPSLSNIYKELSTDVGCTIPNNGYLVKWADQGVLLLNAVLTVRAHEANSHKGIGWEIFTDSVMQILNEQDSPIVFLLWGSYAFKKASMLNNPKHLILKAPHPSPLSSYRGFFGCKHFSQTNNFLANNNLTTIDWQIDNI